MWTVGNPPQAAPQNSESLSRGPAGFFRQNVDASAGGGFSSHTEQGFFGVVGRGYNLNRYNYAALDNAIRPVESQALVPAVHAFRPQVVFDAHGDQPKTPCELDPSSLVPRAVLGVFPSAKCKSPLPSVPTILTSRENMVEGSVSADDATFLEGEQFRSLRSGFEFGNNKNLSRSLAASFINMLNPILRGHMVRFSQLQVGVGTLSSGLFSRAAFPLHAVGTSWEVTNFAPALRPAVLAVNLVNGTLTPSVGPDTFFIGPCYLADNVCIHEQVMEIALRSVTRFSKSPPEEDGSLCTLPLAPGVVGSFPASAGRPDSFASEDPGVIPNAGDFGEPASTADSCM